MDGIIGVLLWICMTFPVLFLIRDQWQRYQTGLPYTYQPLQGARFAAAPKYTPTLRMPFLCQCVMLIGQLISLIRFQWSFSAITSYNIYYGMLCPFHGLFFNAEGEEFYQPFDGAECFTVAGSSWTTFLFLIVSVGLNVMQIVTMQPWRTLHNARIVVPAAGPQATPYAFVPGLWVRTLINLTLHYTMVLLYGGLIFLWSPLKPAEGFYLLLFVTALARAQYYLIMEYIEALPSPHPDGMPGFPQCTPKSAGGDVYPITIHGPGGVSIPVAANSSMVAQPQPLHGSNNVIYPGGSPNWQAGPGVGPAYPVPGYPQPAYGAPTVAVHVRPNPVDNPSAALVVQATQIEGSNAPISLLFHTHS